MAIGALNDNAWYAKDYLMKKYGYTNAQASAVVGNLMQESTFMTNARNKGDGRDGTDSIGIGQWNGDRAKGLLSFASSNEMDPNKLDTQLDYLHHEMQTKETDPYQRLMAAGDNLHDATAAMIGYERPRGYSDKNPTNGDGWGNRLAWATQAYSDDRSGTAPAPVGTLGPIVAGSTGGSSAGSSAVVASAQQDNMIANPNAGKPYKDGFISYVMNKANPDTAPKQPDTVTADASGKATTPERGLLEKIGIGKMPDSVGGVDTAKGLKAFGALGEMMTQNADSVNKQIQGAAQAGQARRASAQPIQTQEIQTPLFGAAGGNANADELKKKLLLAQLGGLGGLA